MIKEALAEYATSIRRVFDHDRDTTVGASEIGQCARRTWYVKHGAAADPGAWGANMRGTIMENHFWEPALRKKYGKDLHFSGSDQRTIEKGWLSATPDGLITGLPRDALSYLQVKDIGAGRCVLVECKSIDPRVDITEAKAENLFQVQVQLGLVRETTKHKPLYALLTYTNASFWDDVTEFAVRFDPEVFRRAKVRAAEILQADGAGNLKPEGYISGGKECEWCPFAEACGIVRRRVPPREVEVDPQFVAELIDLCREYNQIKASAEAGSRRQLELKEEIKDRLRAKGTKKVPDVVSWSEVQGRKSYDDKRLKEDLAKRGIDIEEYSKVGQPSDRLVVSPQLPA